MADTPLDGKEEWTVAYPEKKVEPETWKVPIWQKPIDMASLALHPDGPLCAQKREGYLQKRAGTSRLRWNIRYFDLSDGKLRWWRPGFGEMLKQPVIPKVARTEVSKRPRPIRCLDLSKLRSVTRTRVKFPYSTRILLRFDEGYTKYQLELRAERENIILEWYRVLVRFSMETYEETIEKDEVESREDNTTATGGSLQSDGEDGFTDVEPPSPPSAAGGGCGSGGYPAAGGGGADAPMTAI